MNVLEIKCFKLNVVSGIIWLKIEMLSGSEGVLVFVKVVLKY